MFKFLNIITFTIIILCTIILCEESDSYFGNKNEDLDKCEGDDCQKSEEINTNLKNYSNEVNLIITFTNAIGNNNLIRKFRLTVTSLFEHTSVPLAIHIIGEPESQKLASDIIEDVTKNKKPYRMVNLDVDSLANKLSDVVKVMRSFSTQKGSYYNHALFFLSIGIHRILLTDTFKRVIMLDADLKFQSDIALLNERFSIFTDDNVIGIGYELQPVYRHTFSQYRSKNPGTKVGGPQPDGLTGFNSGVLLLDLEKMSKSKLYNSYLNEKSVQELAKEFYFRGHLGDQDFFTLLSMRHDALFHHLPCTWNRQLCVWWRSHGYADVWDAYHSCPGHIHILHGNCDTTIP